jgi:hypothetical protein
MKKFSYLLFMSVFILSILHSSLVRANDGDRNFKHDRDRDRFEKGDRDGRGERGGDHGSGQGSDGGGARVPLDGGLSILLAAGIGLGVKKVVERNKAGKEEKGDYAA